MWRWIRLNIMNGRKAQESSGTAAENCTLYNTHPKWACVLQLHTVEFTQSRLRPPASTLLLQAPAAAKGLLTLIWHQPFCSHLSPVDNVRLWLYLQIKPDKKDPRLTFPVVDLLLRCQAGTTLHPCPSFTLTFRVRSSLVLVLMRPTVVHCW